MKRMNWTGLLTAVAFAGVLSASGAEFAAAAEMPGMQGDAAVNLAPGSAMPVYYTYHNKRYRYRYHGYYYNHRSWKNGRWRYY